VRQEVFIGNKKGQEVEVSMRSNHVKLTRAVDLLNEKALNGLIIYSDGLSSLLRPAYLHYFSEFKPLGPRNAVVLARSGDIALIVQPAWDGPRASQKTWIRDVRGSSQFLKDLKKIIEEFHLQGPVGVVGMREMKEEVYLGLKRRVEMRPADEIIEEMVREKGEKELALVRKASRIADIGAKAFLDYARVGIREYELVAEMEYAMRSAGAGDIFLLLSSGKHNREMHEPTDRRLEKGDIVIGEITPGVNGQFIQLCRTVILGKASSLLAEKYGILIHALGESLKEIRSGAPASSITIAMNRVIGEAGYGKYCAPPYMRSRGHGFAVGSIAPGGEIDEKMKVNLEKYQVIAVHPNQYIPETGYLACGETILVTDTGAELLSGTETKLFESA
jgi:Xaa-Pro aminopeptidase